MITRRKFLKHLVFVTTAATIAPAAVAKLAAEIPKIAIFHGTPNYYMATEWLTMDELKAYYPSRLDKSPLLRGELGRYQSFTIHEHE